MEVLCRSMCWPHQLKFNTAFAVGPWPAMQGSGSAWAEALQSLLGCRFGCILLLPEAVVPITLSQDTTCCPERWAQKYSPEQKWCCDMLLLNSECCLHVLISKPVLMPESHTQSLPDYSARKTC